jgi:hypothetical protein
MFHAEYAVLKETAEYIYIKDIGDGRTITNDAEFVLEELRAEHALGDRRVFYTDTEGQTDELVHEGGRFLSFKFGHEGVDLQ